MAAEHWFRWHHGTVTDPKWRTVASRASRALSRNVTVGHVVSVWAAMLECASQANPRGNLLGWSDEDVAAGLGFEEEEVRAIREAMQGKTLEKDKLIAWNSRQIKREDATAADRKRAQRERDAKAKSQPVTEDHGASRNVTLETETDKRQSKEPPIPPAGGGRSSARRSKKTFRAFAEECREAGEKLIPPDDPVFAHAEDMGIPVEFVQLAWRAFAHKYRDTDRQQKDWRAHFRNAVRGNWANVWFCRPDGTCELTTVGVQLKRERDAENERRAKQVESEHEEDEAA